MGAHVVAVIPARYASSRFPGKPLALLGGKPMIEHVWEQTRACPGIDEVLVATDDERIRQAVEAFGGCAVMTSPACASGTDRVAEALEGRRADIVVNVQGDQVLLDGQALCGMLRELQAGCPMATIAVPAEREEASDSNCVKVVCALDGTALYFSRAPIPFARQAGQAPLLKHIGIYGFSRQALERFMRLPPSPLERAESLEQLRALENGIPLKVIVAGGRFYEINTPEDHARIQKSWGE